MRKSLSKLERTRTTFRGTFCGYDTKISYYGPEKTVLLENITLAESGDSLNGQVRVKCTKGFSKLRLREGDIVEFDARVTKFKDRRQRNQWDFFDSTVTVGYQLSHPTKVKKIQTDNGLEC